MMISEKMYRWAEDLFPLNRSLSGKFNRITLNYIRNIIPDLKIKSFKSGAKVFDWVVPEEWNVEQAFIEDSNGNKVIDFKNNNLHLLGYSEPVDVFLNLTELKEKLYFLNDKPTAIPYVTSYYKRKWGFCLSLNQYNNLKEDIYHVVINSKFSNGEVNYGELIIPGRTDEEILLSTYICHPSMANNEISGIVVTTALAQMISQINSRRYTYRILFIPETIGAIAYLSLHHEKMRLKTKAGFVVTCVGDDNNYSFLPSRLGNTYTDEVALYTLNNYCSNGFNEYSFLERGSDERQFCSPLIDLPVVSIMRSKYGTYPEYHTSLDDLNFISKKGLLGAYDILTKSINIIEKNIIYFPLVHCEPQLGKRGLYNISSNDDPDHLVNILAYIDGKLDLLNISKILKVDFFECYEICKILEENQLISKNVRK